MIDISSPIQAQSYNSHDVNAENPVSAPVSDSGGRKKGNAGAFSALLEGLTGKSKAKTHAFGAGGADAASQAAENGGLSGGKAGKKTGRNGKTGLSSAETGFEEAAFAVSFVNGGENGRGIHGGFDLSGAEGLEDLSQVTFQTMLDTDFDASPSRGLDAEGAPLLGRRERSGGVFGAGNGLFGGGAAEGGAAGEAGADASAALEAEFFADEENGGTDFPDGIEAEGRGKNPRGAVDLLSASARNSDQRSAENRLFEFSGEKRPGLVDVLSGISSDSAETGGAEKTREGRAKRKTERSGLEVRDFRSAESGVSAETGQNAANAVFSAERVDAEIVSDLRLGAASRGNGGEVFSGGGGFEEALSRELGQHLSGDIVRQASLLLRDNGEGIIRLSLKPETLGNIKIRLEMTENKITGHIVVESSEAFKAFERELPVLEKQFQDSGFGEAHLEMSFSEDGASYSGAGNGENREESMRFSRLVAAARYDSETERASVSGGGVPDGVSGISAPQNAVNILI